VIELVGHTCEERGWYLNAVGGVLAVLFGLYPFVFLFPLSLVFSRWTLYYIMISS
jgi:hypothetical protein